MRIKFPNSKIILIIILIIGAFLRFYKLDWGEGLFAHPDEYHIVASVNQLSFPHQMNPHFFNYGTVVIYLIYFTKIALEFVSSSLNFHPSVINSFLNPFLIGRFYSAFFSTLTIIVVYKICCLILERKWALIASFLVALTPGLIQQAHFATPESLLTFFIFGSLFFLLKFVQLERVDDAIISSASLGLALGVKVVAVLFTPILAMGMLLKLWRKPKKMILVLPLCLLFVLTIFYFVAPYVFLDSPAWRGSTDYEAGLALGKIPVFYTRQFINTLPFIFQMEKILPFTIGPIMETFGFLGVGLILVNFLKKPKLEYFLIISSFLILFISNGLLFAKWTRFLAPALPFFAIFSVFFLYEVKRLSRKFFEILLIVTIASTTIWTLAFFSIYLTSDVRISASNWLLQNTSSTSLFLVEGGNMVDLPLSSDFRKISLDFYNLETDPTIQQKIINGLLTSDYFLVQSRRVFLNHMRIPALFPKTAQFYNGLFSGSLGFEQIKEFHSYPALSFLGFKIEFPDEQAEETWRVFDHPVLRVFKKKVNLNREDYAKFIE